MGDMEVVLDAQAHVWKHTFSFINSISLKCALELGIPDIIHSHGNPMPLSGLLAALPNIPASKAQSIRRLMRLLVHSKFFIIIPPGQGVGHLEDHYCLTDASRLLLKDAPNTLAPFVQLVLDPVLTKPWDCMSQWLVSSEEEYSSPYEAAHGRSFWDDLGRQDSRLSKLFVETMSMDSRLLIPMLLKSYKQVFEGIEVLVDVGGGIGTTSQMIIDAFPTMKCIALDLPHVVAGLDGTNNLTFVGGDMFQSIPAADAVFLKWILHDWNDQDCVRILNKCKEALLINNRESGGGIGKKKVIIIEMVLGEEEDDDDNDDDEAKMLFDMAMLTYLNGKERSEHEWAKLFSDAGFRSYRVNHVLGIRSVIEVYP